MPKQPKLDSKEAEKMLLKAGYIHARSKGSHRIYQKGIKKIVVPFHTGKTLHPKIIKQVLKAIKE